MSIRNNPFVVDGPLPPDSDMYIERATDSALRDACLKGEIVNVPASPRMGKTSLMFRTHEWLREKGARCVIDPRPTTYESDEDWFEKFVSLVTDAGRLKFDGRKWWKEKQDLELTDRLVGLFEEIALETSRQTVVFIDEFETLSQTALDVTFLRFIRKFHEKRTRNPSLNRISLILFSSTRLDLNRVEEGFPLEIIRILLLTDFTLGEAQRLADAFRIGPETQTEFIREAFEWTSGHPYLTQRACWEIFEALPSESFDGPETPIRDYFLNNYNDPQLDHIRIVLSITPVLKEYQRILTGSRSTARDASAVAYMMNSGLLKPGSTTEVRNRIYREVFNEQWVEEQIHEKQSEDLFDGRDLSLRLGGFTVEGRYRLERRLGSGNLYLTHDQILGRSIAIRLIPAHYLITEDRPEDLAYKHFREHVRARIKSPNVVAILDSGFSSDRNYFYVVTEYVEGRSLAAFVFPLPDNDTALRILSDIVNAVDAAHLAGVLHGSLTPFTIFSSGDNVFPIKVSDFGRAQLMNKGPHGKPTEPPEDGEVGDPVYMAPEQFVGEGPWDHRADIYALGMIAYQIFGGQVPPFENLSNILKLKLEKRFVSLRKLREGIPEAAEQAIMRALEVDPNDRPSSARAWFDEVSAAFKSPDPSTETTQPSAIGEFEIPIVLDSQFTVTAPETTTIETATARLRETVFGGIKLVPHESRDLRGSVFVGVIRESYALRQFKQAYTQAKRSALKTIIYIKREEEVTLRRFPEALPPNEFDDLKKEMLADGAAEFFNSTTELGGLFIFELTEWLIKQYLPEALERAKQSSSEAITQLLANIKDPEGLDEKALDELRKQQVASTGRYWFYLSCAQEDWLDDDVKEFFQQLNAEVRALAGASEFYVGAFRSSTSEVAATALRQEWFPETVAALQNSRVLVPLYTREYFESEVCGKVWEFFNLRVVAENTPAPIILPVLWSPNEDLPYPLPDRVAPIQYMHYRHYTERSGEVSSERGLRYLKTRHKDQYEEFIREFAQRLVEVATAYEVQPLAEPPTYAEITNAFTVRAEQTSETSPPPPRMGRWIAVAGSGTSELPDDIRNLSIELGREMARRGYGLISGGYTGVDYFVKQGFAEVLGGEKLLSGSLKVVHYRHDQPSFSGGATIVVNRQQSVIEEEVKLSDAVVLISGHDGTYAFYPIAQRLGIPVFPIWLSGLAAQAVFNEIEKTWLTTPPSHPGFQDLKRPIETEADARRMTRTLLEMIDRLWLSPTTPRTNDEALASISFIQGDLLRQHADAIVNSVALNPTDWGEVGEDLLERMGYLFREELAAQGPLTTGETLVTRADQFLSSRYVISVCSDAADGSKTIESFASAVRGALKRAELLGLETIAFPSIGTGAAGFSAEALAPPILNAVVDHLMQGSRLQTVLFAFKNLDDYESYFKAFTEIGGKPGYRTLMFSFSPRALRGLQFAESARIKLGRNRISSSLLLWGLYQVPLSPTEELLQSSHTEVDINATFRERLGIIDEKLLIGIGLAPLSTMGFASFTPHCDEALVKAKELAGTAEISERHLLAGLLSISEAQGTKWLSEMMGVPSAELYDIVAVHGDETGKSITAEIALRREQQVTVETTAWTISLTPPQIDGQDLNEIRVGERVTFTISLEPALNVAETSKNTLRIPANSLELTGWIHAPGCQLPLEIPFTIKTIDGLPETKTFSFDLKPLLSGSRTIEIEIYPGGHVSNLGPAIVTRTFSVASPIVLPDIKELIDRRQIPHPQPDVMLYVALQETPTHQQTQIYLTCAALELDRQPLEPALPLNERDIAELRRFAVESAAKGSELSPADSLAVMRSVGAELFDRLINKEFESYFHEINQLAAITNRTWSWLVISDEHAVLPWELVCYYGSDGETIRYDDFVGDKFQVAHWVGQRGLRLMNTVPVGDVDFIHYHQRSDAIKAWTSILGPDTVESDAGELSLLKENSYCFGLHLLRYAQERQTKQIIGINDEEHGDGKVNGDAITGDQKLDLTLRRPTVGLSFVSELPASALGTVASDTHLESSWLLPFMQAGASALFGPRWPVSVEVDQVFVKEFYDAMRGGETLGAAFFKARARVRTAFPQRTDWLAYTYFGHPHAEPYEVQPAQGFTLFEAVDSPKDEFFHAGGTYRFRASYRTEAPAWYDGRLQIQYGSIATQDLSVMVLPLTGEQPTYCSLTPVAEGNELQGMVSLTMPELEKNATASLPVMVRFQKATEELRTLVLNLQVKGGF